MIYRRTLVKSMHQDMHPFHNDSPEEDEDETSPLVEQKIAPFRCSRQTLFKCCIWIAFLYAAIMTLKEFVLWSRQTSIFDPVRVERVSSQDDLSLGKSCKHNQRFWGWHCQECHNNNNHRCKVLHPRPLCASFARQEWDTFPRSVSHYDPTTTATQPARMLNFLGKFYYEQTECTVMECWDLERCRDNEFTVYINSTNQQRLHELVDCAVQNFNVSNIVMKRVQDFQDACLVLIEDGIYPTVQALKSAASWNQGRNNLFWRLSYIHYKDISRTFSGDFPFHFFDLEQAAVASESLSRAHIRIAYDMALPLRRKWGRHQPPEQVDIHRPRKYLLSFRGRIMTNRNPYYQHRWLALSYWEESPDIVVDGRCIHVDRWSGKNSLEKPYELPDSSYDDMIWNSTFGFAPGGSGVGSFRFGEILSTGGIPVVVPDFVPPFTPEINWSDCVVQVSEARIIDLPRILREISPAEILARQKACWRLLHVVFGDHDEGGAWRSDERVTFTTAMEIWSLRIAHAKKMKAMFK